MTSQASLAKNKNNNSFWTNFKNNIKNANAFPISIFALLTLMYPVLSIKTINKIIDSNIFENPNYNIVNDYKYILTDTRSIMDIGVTIPYLLLFAGIFLGVLKFKFMLRKNTVNVYFSLGITRTKMFSSTYLAGAVQLLLATFVPMLIVLFINMGYIGFSKELMLATLILAVGYFATALFGFSISSLITSAVGTYGEAILYSLIIVFLPNIIFGCINELMTLFLMGNEYVISGSGNYMSYSLKIDVPSLSEKFAYLVPCNFFSDSMTFYHTLTSKSIIPISTFSGDIFQKWVTPNFIRSIGWIITSVVIWGLSIFTLNKRRAESAGFLGSNRIVNFIMTFIICFATSCLSVFVFTKFISRTPSILLSIVVFAVVYMIINIIFTRKVKLFVKTLTKLPIHMCIGLVFCMFFVTGLFGYSSKVPEISDIKTVDMSIPCGNSLAMTSSRSGGEASVDFGALNDHLRSITSKNDFKIVTKLHKQVIKDGKLKYDEENPAKSLNDSVFGNFYIKYTLKNGKTLTRYYEHVKVSTLIKMLEIEDTEHYNNLLESIFTQPISKSDSNQIMGLKETIQGENTNIYLLSKHLDIRSPLNINENKRKELQKCITKDLKNQTVTERYMPKTETLGIISFISGTVVNDDSDGDIMSSPNQNDVQNNDEEISKPELTTDMLTAISNTADYEPKYFVCVTQDMKNTVKFIEDNALLKYFDNNTKVVSAEIIDRNIYNELESWKLSYNDGLTQMFFGGRTSKELLSQNGNEDYSVFKQSFKISDKKTITKLEQNSYYNYFAPINGYLVRYTLDNGDKIVMFVPENKVPKNIKAGVSHINIKDDDVR